MNKIINKNMNNLKQLFKCMGIKENRCDDELNYYASRSWPNRIWMSSNHAHVDVKKLIEKNGTLGHQYTISIWENKVENLEKSIELFENNNYDLSFEQVGMHLEINDLIPEYNDDLEIVIINNKEEILKWVEIASLSFGYTIHSDVILELNKNEDAHLFLAYKDNIAVGTVLLYKSDDLMGVHLVGVPKEHRGGGIAKSIMSETIKFTKNLNINVMTLQASSLGLGIYKRLGFQEDFILKNYKYKV